MEDDFPSLEFARASCASLSLPRASSRSSLSTPKSSSESMSLISSSSEPSEYTSSNVSLRGTFSVWISVMVAGPRPSTRIESTLM